MDNTRNRAIMQYALGIILGIAAGVAGAISLGMNWSFGAQFGGWCAVIFAVSDCVKICLPVIAAALGAWDTKRRSAYLVALAISLVAAASSLLQGQAQVIKDRAAAEQITKTTRAEVERISASLAGIKETMSPATLKALAADENAKAEREAARGGCGKVCESYRAAATAYVERMGQAQAKAHLQGQLAAAKATIAATPDRAIGPADSIAALTGGDRLQIANAFSVAISIAQLIILELIAAFSGDAGLLIRNAFANVRKFRKVRNATTTVSQPIATQAAANSQPEAPRQANGVGTRDYYKDRLRRDHPELFAKVENCELSVYRASIAAGLRKAPKGYKWNANDYAKEMA